MGCQEGEVLRICALPLATPTGFGPNRFSIAKIEVSLHAARASSAFSTLALPPGCPASSLCPTGKIQVAAVSWGQDKIPKHLMAVGSLFLVGLGPQKELISASDMLYVQKEYSTDTGQGLTWATCSENMIAQSCPGVGSPWEEPGILANSEV